jgi:peptidyl-prolyl cis-trans isomerase C
MSSLTFSLRVSTCLAVLFAVFSLSCRSKSNDETEANKPRQNPDRIEARTDVKTDVNSVVNSVEPAPAEQPYNNIAVTINGVDILEDELQRIIKPQLEQMAKQNKQLPPAFAQAYRKQIRQKALDRIIVGQLLGEKVKEKNIVITEEEVTGQLTKIAAAQKPPMSLEELKEKTAQYGQDFDELKRQIRKGMAYQKIVEAQWAGKINITEEDAKKYYDENPTKFEIPEQVRASHILIKPDTTDADPNQAKEKAKAKTQDLLEQIEKGADFAALAKANSDCPSAAQGGDLNFFSRGKMVPPFEKAAFDLEVGKVSDIVETQFGYHIIKVTDRKEASTTSFEQAKNNIIRQLTQEKQSEFANEYIESLKAEADIVYPPGKDPASLTNRP